MTPIIATSTSSANYEPCPSGNFVARCYSMIHVGTVLDEYQGEKKWTNKVRITWELPTETKVFKEENGEQPYVLSKTFTLSLNEKATLRKWLESWRGKGFTNEECEKFDISVLVGKPCMLNVIHKTKANGDVRADIASVSTMPKGMECPEQVNPSVIFSVLDFNQDIFDKFPDFLKDEIRSSREYKAMQQPNVVDTPQAPADDLPF